MLILAIRTDSPEAELHLFDVERSNSREEQPEQKSHFLPWLRSRNPEGVSYGSVKWQAHRELSDTIHLKIQEILNKSSKQLGEVEGLIVFKGPGSFTGLRIGVVIANTLAYALNIPIVGSLGDNWLIDGAQKLLAGQNDQMVLPEYGKAANITTPRK